MEKRILSYRKRIDELLQQEDANWEKILEEHLTQVAFFQHERLIHLIVTVPIFLEHEKKIMQVEIQLRTLAMDLWASMEVTSVTCPG